MLQRLRFKIFLCSSTILSLWAAGFFLINPLLLSFHNDAVVEGFVITSPKAIVKSSSDISTSLFLAKRKESMAQKRKRRAKKAPQAVAITRPKLSTPIGATPPPPTTTENENETETEKDTQQQQLDNDDNDLDKDFHEKKKISDPQVAAQRAKQLLQAQRTSVDMLTHVRERIEECLSSNSTTTTTTTTISQDLSTKGYFIVDDFLSRLEFVTQLQQEAFDRMEQLKMQVDMSNIGSGEYIVPIQGGADQYKDCPRCVEFVVSTTKHVPTVVTTTTKAFLDASNCMATLRTFDRKAYKASLELLLQKNNNNNTDNNIVESDQRPFGIVATEENDARQLSLFYYIVPNEWAGDGGITFESTGETIQAKSNRLVVFYSDTTSFRRNRWVGSDNNNNNCDKGSCLEIHLIKKSLKK